MPHAENDRIVESTSEARAGVTGHNVRYVLLSYRSFRNRLCGDQGLILWPASGFSRRGIPALFCKTNRSA
jgi:hypothetical protein